MSAKAPQSSQETPARPKSVSHSEYRSNLLISARQAVIEDLGSWIPEVEFEYLLDNIIRYNDVDVIETESNLLKSGCLSPETGWSKFATSPSKSNKDETDTFAPLKDVREQILQHTASVDPQNTNTEVTLNYRSEPNQTPVSTRYNTSRPDGYGHLSESHPYSTASCRVDGVSEVDWLDIGYAEEYKKADSMKNRYDNATKILWSLQHIMRNDPRRRYTFGITIEDSNTRLWFCCRSSVLVSKSFDFIKEPRQLIRLVTSLSLASPTQLGWDPTMKLVRGLGKPAKNIWAYDIQVRSRDKDGNLTTQIYRTEDVLSDFSADAIRGRATRVFKARLVDANGEVVGDPVVVKDVWLDADRPNEAEILKIILEGCSDEERKYFLTILAHGPVVIDDRDDHTLDLILNGVNINYPEVNENSETPTNNFFRIKTRPSDQDPRTFDPAKHHSDSTGSHRMASLAARARNGHHRFSHKVHTRFVYKEVCSPLYKVRSTKQIFLALQHTVEGLEIMKRKGFVHRDISPGNILFIDGQGKLTDLEYAIRKGSGGKHDVRTGTIDFMAIDVERGSYIIGNGDLRFSMEVPFVKPSTPTFMHNYLHDLESVWWVGIWSLAWSCLEENYDVIPASIYKQRRFVERLFEHTTHTTSSNREDFLIAADTFLTIFDYLPSQLHNNLVVFGVMRSLLLDSFAAHISERTIHEEIFTDIHSKFGTILDAAQRLEDINIYPLPSIKRPRTPTMSTANDEKPDSQSSKRQKQGSLDSK